MQPMLKKIVVIAAALALLASLAGCSCSDTPVATPTPTLSPTTALTPEILEPVPGDDGMLPDGTGTPDASASPDANGTGTGTGTGTDTGAGTIENFKEGTEVKEADVPAVTKAIQAKYESAKIKSIRHAMNNGKQVYAVDITVGSTTQTVYVQPDGTLAQ